MSYCCTSTSCAARREIRLAGASFALLFTAYNTAQNYLTTLLGQRFGSSVLALVYAGLICATPFAPSLVPRMGVRLALVLGSATYALLMAALTLFAGSGGGALVASLLCVAAFLNGCGGALLWSAQGSLVIRSSGGGGGGSGSGSGSGSSADETARQAGDFWGIFQLSAVAGNLWASVSLAHGGSSVGLFATFTALALSGSVLFLGLRSPRHAALAQRDGACPPPLELAGSPLPQPPQPPQLPQPPQPPQWREVAAREAVAMGRFVRRTRALAPLLVLGGLLMAYQFGQFPLRLTPAAVGAVFTAFGCAEVAGALAAGRLVPRIGLPRYRRLTVALTAASLLAAAPLELRAAGGAAAIGLDRPAALLLPMAAATLFGLADSAIAVLAYCALARAAADGGGAGGGGGVGNGGRDGSTSPEAASAQAGGCRQLLYSCGFLIGFVLGPHVSGGWQLVAMAGLLVCAALQPLPASEEASVGSERRGLCLLGVGHAHG